MISHKFLNFSVDVAGGLVILVTSPFSKIYVTLNTYTFCLIGM